MINKLYSRTTEINTSSLLSGVFVSTAYQYIALAAITFLAAGLRLYKLGEWGFWIDEVFTLGYVLRDQGSLWFPLSFRMIWAAIQVLGISDWSVRLAPALIGIITLPALFFPLRKFFGPIVALLAVAILALSPWHLYWSQNARFYTALLLFYGLGSFAFFQWLETDRLRYLFMAAVMMLLAAMERLNTVYFAPVVALYLLALLTLPFGKPPGLRWRNILMMAAPAVPVALYLIFVLGVLSDLSTWIFGRVHDPFRVLLSLIYDIGLPLFLLGLLGGAYLLLQRSRLGLFFVLNAVIPVILLTATASFTQSFSRYAFMVLPFWALLGAVAAMEIFVQSQRHVKVIALGVVLLLFADAVSQNVLYYGFQNGNRENFKDAFAMVQEQGLPTDQVVSTRPEIAEHYLGMQAIDSNRIDLDGIEAEGKRTWFVLDSRTHISDKLQAWVDQNSELTGVFDVHMPGKSMLMRVYLFDPAE
jgi:mannosyltransferase